MPRIRPCSLGCLAAGIFAFCWSVFSPAAIADTEQVAAAYRGWLKSSGLGVLIEVDEISEHSAALAESLVGEHPSRSEPSERRYVLHLRSALDEGSWTEFSQAASARLGTPLPHRLLSRFAQLLAVPGSEVRVDLALACAWLSYVADRRGAVELDWSSPCKGPSASTDLPWRQMVAGLSTQKKVDYQVVDVFYGTDRASSEPSNGMRNYGAARGALALGRCTVSIPRDHRVGLLEAPSIWRFELRTDPEKHVVVLSVAEQPRDRFVEDLRRIVGRSKAKAAFVFIHGHNVTFADAARRTAQLAYDLQFDGAPILYSWPSRDGRTDYSADETTVQWTVPHLNEFLSLVAAEAGAEAVHLIAHSMGNRALTEVIRQFVESPAPPRFSQIALLTPDIDATIFKRDLAAGIVASARRVTLYASSNDEALKASERVHDAPRAGQAGDRIVVVPGVDTIDVSVLDTSLERHSHFAENRSVISDLFYLLRGQDAPESRFGLERVSSGELAYWRFRSER